MKINKKTPFNKKGVWLAIFILLFLAPIFCFAFLPYTPMEEIPGYGKPTDFPSYIVAIYKFGLWTVGIAAMLMIMIGGYMYLTSAGNTSRTGKAKGIIYDAIAGIILALASYLILYTINPDLLNINPITPEAGIGSGNAPITGSTGYGTGKCTPVASGPCSIANLQNTCFGANAQQASAICQAESTGNQKVGSSVDKCLPGGQPVSWGLFQINLTYHSVGGLNCPAAFSAQYNGTNHQCNIVDANLYNKCVAAAQIPANNIAVACTISSGGTKWGQWGANESCGFNK